MSGKVVRAAIVGASSLLGKELAEELNDSASTQWDLKLLDAGADAVQLTSSGDEALVIQPFEPDMFTAMDVVFFAGDSITTNDNWKLAADAGACIIDMTGALEGQPGVIVSAPWIRPGADSPMLDLSTTAIVSAHPVAVMLGVTLSRIDERFKVSRAVATVLEPASQAGSAGLDEMHGQTVSLLSFQSVPKDVFDTQVAFNFNVALGSASKINLDTISRRITHDLQSVTSQTLAGKTTLQLVQAPVFNGYAISMFIEIGEATDIDALEQVLDGGIVSVTSADDPAPSNLSATEERQLLIRVRTERESQESNGSAGQETGFWLWMAADNLRLAARNAVACATDLLALRPSGRLQ